MDKKEQILHYHRIDGLSQRDIARRVGVSRKTVKRYITEYEAMMMSNPEEGIDMCLASRPKYPSRNTGPVKLTEAVCAEIVIILHKMKKYTKIFGILRKSSYLCSVRTYVLTIQVSFLRGQAVYVTTQFIKPYIKCAALTFVEAASARHNSNTFGSALTYSRL